MKQKIKLVVVVALVLQLLTMLVMANDIVTTYSFTNAITNPGKEIAIELSFESPVEVDSLGMENLTFNTEILTFKSFVVDDENDYLPSKAELSDFMDTDMTFVMGSSKWKQYVGKICTLVFEVAENAPDGEYTVSFDGIVKKGSIDYNNEVIPATITVTHDHVFGDPTPAKTANCKEGGNVEYYTCSVCNKNYADNLGNVLLDKVTTDIDSTNHVGAKDGAELVNTDSAGHYYLCKCEQPLTAPIPHSYESWTPNQNGTEHTHTCECGYSVSEAHTGGTAYCDAKKECEVCGAEYGEKNANSHKEFNAATCVSAKTCKVCNGTVDDILDSTNHDGTTRLEGKDEPSCWENGYTGDTYCNGCNQPIATGTTDPATGNHVWADTLSKDNDNHWYACNTEGCTEKNGLAAHSASTWVDKDDGENHTGTCVCGEVLTRAHREGTPANCTNKAVCADCSASYGNVAPDVHVEGTPATCLEQAICALNSEHKYGALSTTNHVGAVNPDEWIADTENRNHHYQECECDAPINNAACREFDDFIQCDGYGQPFYWHNGECTLCEATKTFNCTFDNGVVTLEPTSKETGIMTYTCTACGGSYDEILPIDNSGELGVLIQDIQSKRKVTITASANELGLITDAGETKLSKGQSMHYSFVPNLGCEIVSVIVDGEDIGVVSEYTFENVSKNHTIEVVFAEIKLPFTDITPESEGYDAVKFVFDSGLFKGMSEDTFGGELAMTRAMFATVIGRLHGITEDVVTVATFEDVVVTEWYAPYVEWAASCGIVNGYGNGLFGVEDEITVEQACVMLVRYLNYLGEDVSSEYSLDEFSDADSVAVWADAAMKWAVENGIYVADGALTPSADASRLLLAQMLYNLVNAE